MILKMLSCDFCGKLAAHVDFLVACPSAMICDTCAQTAVDIIKEERDKRAMGQQGTQPENVIEKWQS